MSELELPELDIKEIIKNSDISYPFIISGNDNSKKLFCFSSILEALAHKTISIILELEDINDHRILTFSPTAKVGGFISD